MKRIVVIDASAYLTFYYNNRAGRNTKQVFQSLSKNERKYSPMLHTFFVQEVLNRFAEELKHGNINESEYNRLRDEFAVWRAQHGLIAYPRNEADVLTAEKFVI